MTQGNGQTTYGSSAQSNSQASNGESTPYIDWRKDITFERPFNIFAAAGASYRVGNQYKAYISPADFTVQFQEIKPTITRFSLGVVWNPLKNFSMNNISHYLESKRMQDAANATRKYLAVALIINVFELNFSGDTFDSTSPIDLGFGVGFRNDNFLALFTIEFTPTRTPTDKFFYDYYRENKQLILPGETEPEKTLDIDSDLFYNKTFTSIGFKIAYAFSKK